MSSKFWISFCFLFLAYNLYLLIGDNYKVNYMIVEKEDKLYDDSFSLLTCVREAEMRAKSFSRNNFNYSYSDIRGRFVPVRTYLNYSIKLIEKFLNASNLFKINESYYFDYSICFLTTKDDLSKENPFNGLYRNYETKVFALLKNQKSLINELFYTSLVDLNGFTIKKQKVYNEKYLLDQSCIKDKLKLDENCRQKCIGKNIGTYAYDIYDYMNKDFKMNLEAIFVFRSTIEIEIPKEEINNASEDEKLEEPKKETETHQSFSKKDYDEFKKCNEKCSENFCTFESFTSYFVKKKQNENLKFQTSVYVADYKMQHFWLQFIGLILFFTENCVMEFVFYTVISISRRFRLDSRRYFSVIYSNFKLIFVLLSMIFVISQSLFMILDYDFKSNYPNKTAFINYSNEVPSLIACFPIDTLIYDANPKIDQVSTGNLIRNLNFEEIENLTNYRDNIIQYINFTFANELRDEYFDWIVSNEVLFKNQIFNGSNYLSRCFRIQFDYKKRLRYEALHPFYHLIIKLNEKYPRSLYLVDESEKFTSNLTEFKNFESVRKIIKISSSKSKKAKCTDYKKLALNCTTKMNCVVNCINQEFYRQHSSLSLYSTIDKDELNFDPTKIKFNDDQLKYNEIEKFCHESYIDFKNCKEITYEESFEKKDYFEGVLIELNYENYYEVDLETSFDKTILNIFNLECIIFGTNVISSLSWLFSIFIKRNSKWVKSFIFVICGLGFCFHFILIIESIINEELGKEFYLKELESNKLPDIIICIEMNEKIENLIDHNFKLTGQLLNKETKRINFQNIFNEFIYFNKTHFIYLKPYGTNFLDSQISLRFSYLLNFKCVIIEHQKSDFISHNLKFNEDNIIAAINFNNNIGPINLFFRQKESYQFSNILKHRFKHKKDFYRECNCTVFNNLQIDLELTEIERYDTFEYLKNPKSLFFKSVNLYDATSYLNNLRKEFKELTNRTTKSILLDDTEDDFKLTIDDDLFFQYYLQIQNYSDHNYPKSLNFKQSYYDCNVNYFVQTRSLIKFKLMPQIRKIEISNKETHSSLLLNLLNILSFWLGIGVLNLYNCIIYCFKLIKKPYHFFIKLKIRLKRKVNLLLTKKPIFKIKRKS